MKKIIFILFFVFFLWNTSFSYEKPEIISRETWWANSDYININSDIWKNIIKKQEEKKEKNKKLTKKELLNLKKEKESINMLNKYFYNDLKLSETLTELNWIKLAWPIEKSAKIRAIVIHHTDTKTDNSLDSIKSIYKYHSIYKEWWDIWYNYLIWKDWEIFEWRAWWDFSVWAHDKRNNRQTIWISFIWKYDENSISKEQYESLYNLIWYLLEKYEINPTKKTAFHRVCVKTNCENYLETIYDFPIIGHRDAWHTDCPWDALYSQLLIMRNKIISDYEKEQKLLKRQELYNNFFKKYNREKLVKIGENIEKLLEQKLSNKDKKLLEEVKKYYIIYMQNL